jgi:hypothetical protein
MLEKLSYKDPKLISVTSNNVKRYIRHVLRARWLQEHLTVESNATTVAYKNLTGGQLGEAERVLGVILK